MTDSLPVCGGLQRELQGQAVEGRAGDLSLRIELISLVSHRLLLLLSACCLILKVKSVAPVAHMHPLQLMQVFFLSTFTQCMYYTHLRTHLHTDRPHTFSWVGFFRQSI